MGTREIANNIFVNTDYEGGNVACINSNQGIILIDTPTLQKDIEEWKRFVTELNPGGPDYIINTHIHFDHVIGNNRMGGKVIMHRNGSEMLLKGGTLRENLSNMMMWPEEEVKFILDEPLVSPDISFNDKMTVYSGDFTFELVHTGGHSSDTIFIYIPEAKLLATGDNLTAGRHPFKGVSSFSDWIKALGIMKLYDVDYVIPGHGEVCGKEEIDKFEEYFQKQYNLARDLVSAGASKEQLVKKLHDEIFDFFENDPETIKRSETMFDMGSVRLYKEIQNNFNR